MRAISWPVRAGKVCAWRGNSAAAAVLLSVLIPVAGSTPAVRETCSAISLFPVRPGRRRVGGSNHACRLAAVSRLRFSAFQIFPQRQLEPVAPLVTLGMFALAF